MNGDASTGQFVTVSTHVLDMVHGTPAGDVHVRLERRDATGWRQLSEGRTDSDGRVAHRVPMRGRRAGGYRLVFYVEPYLGGGAFFPEIIVAFQVTDTDRDYHVPLLLSPYGYTTYRGS